MRITEILLPKGLTDKSLSSVSIKKIDLLQARMDRYVDKICKMASGTARDFLKAKLKADYTSLRDIIQKTSIAEDSLGNTLPWPEFINKFSSAMRATGWKSKRHGDNGYLFSTKGDESDDQYYMIVVENAGDSWLNYALGTVEEGHPHIDDSMKGELPITEASLSELINMVREGFGLTERISEDDATKYEVYDTKTKDKVSGPYANLRRASNAAEKKNQEYGAVRYGYRQVKKLTEAVNKLPLTPEDFELVKKLLERPIPAIVAPIYIMEVIDDDELTDQFKSLEETDPSRDVRPLIVEWFNRVMPDQMYRFGQEQADETLSKGMLSLIHGYDPKENKGSGVALTGNAYGRR